MNRRSFLKLFSAAVVKPTYFLPPVGGWHDNRFMSVDWGFGPSRSVVTMVEHDRIIHIGAMGIYENGLMISHMIYPREITLD